jgi:hypothetical protein
LHLTVILFLTIIHLEINMERLIPYEKKIVITKSYCRFLHCVQLYLMLLIL